MKIKKVVGVNKHKEVQFDNYRNVLELHTVSLL